jgi:hypothetical protein
MLNNLDELKIAMDKLAKRSGGVWAERWILEATIVVSDDLQVFHSIMLTTTSVHSVTHFHKGMIPKQSRRAGPTLLGNGMIVPYDETLLTLQCRRKACPGRLYTLEAHYLEEDTLLSQLCVPSIYLNVHVQLSLGD